MANYQQQQPPPPPPPSSSSLLPFSFPPPTQPPPNTYQDSQRGVAPDVRQAPPESQWSLPGLNLQSFGQNTQQQQQYPPWPPPPAQLPNGWPPFPFPPFFPQNGIPPPPHHSMISFPPPPQTLPSAQAQVPQHHIAAPPERFTEKMNIDREAGEVSDVTRTSGSPAGSGYHTLSNPELPRSVPQVPQDGPRSHRRGPNNHHGTYNPDRTAIRRGPSEPPPSQESHRATSSRITSNVIQQREEAKEFVKLLHSNNIGYSTLVNEGLDPELLEALYQSMNLPSEPASVAAPAEKLNDGAAQAKPTPYIRTNGNSVPPVKSAPSPIDRKDYIARLQAAKMSKQSASAKDSPPHNNTPATNVAPSLTPRSPAVTTTSAPPTAVDDEDKKQKANAAIRGRLEALKAQRKLQGTPPGANTLPPPTQKPEQAHTLVSQASETTAPVPSAHSSQPFQVPSFSGIPGLFMNALPPPPNPTISPSSQSHPNARGQTSTANSTNGSTPGGALSAHSQPHGISSEQATGSSVAEVGDDDSAGSDMDIEEDQEALNPVSFLPSTPNTGTQHLIRSRPVFHELPSRPGSAVSVSVISTPGAQTPGSLARQEHLKSKENEIAALKLSLRKRLEEQRLKAKAVAASFTTQRTVMTPIGKETPKSVPTTPHVSQPVFLPQSTGRVVPSGSPSQTPADLRRQRRAEIESRLPSIEAELVGSLARVDQLMKELQELQAFNERMTKDKEKLIQELEGLGVDTDGMPHAELQAKKNEIELQNDAAPATIPGLSSQHSAGFGNICDGPNPATIPSQDLSQVNATANGTKQPSYSTDIPSAIRPVQVPGLSTINTTQILVDEPDIPSPSGLAVKIDHSTSHTSTSVSGSARSDNRVPTPARAAKPSVATPQDSISCVDDEEDFYSLEPAGHARLGDNVATEDAIATAKSPSEESGVEMSESSEEDYEPEEPKTPVNAVHEMTSNDVESMHSTSSSSSASSSDDEESYEPSDINRQVSQVTPEPRMGDCDVDVEDEPEEDAMDMSTSSSDESEGSDLAKEGSIPGRNVPELTAIVDEAPTLQSDHTHGEATMVPAQISTIDDVVQTPRFVPYESPLRMFKSYRYHPNFSQEVAGGFLSMTYSHQIDPNKPLCPVEASGGICNDAHCTGQHFRGMDITGDKLLVQLGTANPGKTAEERQSWNDGLRGVLKELRQRNIKDPNGIAEEIVKYRRQYLNDNTRVVNL